jgi:hypothetical protein
MRQAKVIMTFLILSFVSEAVAQTTTVEVTVQSVKPEAKEITVGYKTNLGNKTITLDVSRKAEITLNGEEATLESLGPGQKATVDYNRELEIVTKIVATGKTVTVPELVEVKELNHVYQFCLSEDGLAIYFEKQGKIHVARRNDQNSIFEDVQPIFEGRQPSVTNDGLEMVFTGQPSSDSETKVLFSTTRDSKDRSFRRPKQLFEQPYFNPCLSSDGLTLYANWYREKGKLVFVVATRSDRNSPWSEPQAINVVGSNLFTHLTGPYVMDDGLTLFCVIESGEIWASARGNLLKFTRNTPDEDFGNPEYVEIEGIPKLTGRYPRFVPATNEFFFLKADGHFSKSQLVSIKHFVP